MCKKRLFYNWKFFIVVCFFQALYGFLSVTIALVLNYFIDIISNADSSSAIIKIGIISFIYVTVYVGARAIADSLAYMYCNNAAKHLRNDIFCAVLSMNYSDFTKKDSGDYLNRISNDVRMINENYYIQIFSMVTFVTQFVFCVIYSIYINVIIAVILFALTILQALVPVVYDKPMNNAMSRVSKENSFLMSKIKELLLGFEVIKSYKCERISFKEYEAVNKSVTLAQRKSDIIKQIMMKSNLWVAWIIIFSSVVTSGILVLNGKMTIANLFAAFYLANHYTMPVMDFFSSYTMVKANKVIRKKTDDFIAENMTMPIDGVAYLPHNKNEDVGNFDQNKELYSMRNCLNVKNLSFSYADGQLVIDNLSYTFQKGRKYLILGESGCGKSSLLKIIAGFYETDSVYFDENPETVGKGKGILLVSQQPYLFNKSIKRNIDILDLNNPELFSEVVEKCVLSEYIDTLPDGADSIVDEEVNRASGGQKARIGLARALYNKPDVLLVDEITSSLDNEIAHRIEEMLLSLKGVLVIHVTHKPFDDLIERYDDVINMNK